MIYLSGRMDGLDSREGFSIRGSLYLMLFILLGIIFKIVLKWRRRRNRERIRRVPSITA